MDCGSFSIAQTTLLLKRLGSQINTTAQSHTPEAVHDLRVSSRRFSPTLAVSKPFLPTRSARKMRRRIKALMIRSGAVRDCDIALKLLNHSKAEDAAVVEVKLRARRAEAEKALAVLLKPWYTEDLLSKWQRNLKK